MGVCATTGTAVSRTRRSATTRHTGHMRRVFQTTWPPSTAVADSKNKSLRRLRQRLEESQQSELLIVVPLTHRHARVGIEEERAIQMIVAVACIMMIVKVEHAVQRARDDVG